jgi:hypothetical protein
MPHLNDLSESIKTKEYDLSEEMLVQALAGKQLGQPTPLPDSTASKSIVAEP